LIITSPKSSKHDVNENEPQCIYLHTVSSQLLPQAEIQRESHRLHRHDQVNEGEREREHNCRRSQDLLDKAQGGMIDRGHIPAKVTSISYTTRDREDDSHHSATDRP
jgi:hypothetical protein